MSFGFGFSLPTLGWHLSGGGASSGYSVTKSLRFRSSASAYLNRTPATAGTGVGKTWTWSGWVKRGTIASSNLISLMQGQTSGGSTDRGGFGFYTYAGAGTGSDSFTLYYGAAFANNLTTTQVFRDPAAWYHFVLAVDTTQATAANRALLYVNGIQITSFSAANYPTLNYQFAIGNNVAQWLCSESGSGYYFDGEMAEVNFVDGQALAPTAFGAYSIYNQWLPIRYAGTYGTNGFYLPFTNTTSTSTLVADSSGNGNNWTPNNISLTAGSTYDSLTDVPTLTSTTVANYCVLLQIASTMGGQSTITDGNLNYQSPNPSSNYASSGVRASIPFASGKFYWEALINLAPGANGGYFIGVTDSAASLNPGAGFDNGYFWGYNVLTGVVQVNGSTVATVATSTLNDIIGLAYDRTAGTMSVYKNNALLSTQTGTPSGVGGAWVPSMIIDQGFNNGRQIGFNYTFGQRPFTYTPPTGFLPLNTFNI